MNRAQRRAARLSARDWPKEIEKLNASPDGVRRIRCTTPGVAQVTRIRLLDEWDNLRARTEGEVLVLELES